MSRWLRRHKRERKQRKRREREESLKRMDRTGRGLAAEPTEAEIEARTNPAPGVTAASDPTDEREVEKVAKACLTPEEMKAVKAQGTTATAYIQREYDVRPAKYATDQHLLTAISASRRGESVEPGEIYADAGTERSGEPERQSEPVEPETPESLADDEIEAMADGVLTPRESQQAKAMGSATEYVRERFGVNPSDHANEQTLMAAMSAANSGQESEN